MGGMLSLVKFRKAKKMTEDNQIPLSDLSMISPLPHPNPQSDAKVELNSSGSESYKSDWLEESRTNHKEEVTLLYFYINDGNDIYIWCTCCFNVYAILDWSGDIKWWEFENKSAS